MATTAKTKAAAKAPKKATTATKAQAAAAPDGHKTQQKAVSHDEIAALAHRFWLERGRQDGHHHEDWVRAEQQLRGKAS